MEAKARGYKAVNDGEAFPVGATLHYFTVEDGKRAEHYFTTTPEGEVLDIEILN